MTSDVVSTFHLPEGVTVQDVNQRVRDALDEFAAMEPTKFALAHWLCTAYRSALVVGDGTTCPFTLRVTTELAAVITDAQSALAAAREAACVSRSEFLSKLPKLVHVVRIRDALGGEGFAPLEIRGASLADRAISLLLADFLTSPEDFLVTTAA